MNILEIIVIVFVIGMAAFGFYRGFVKKLAAMLSLVLSVTLVSAGLPYVTEFLKTETPLYSYIVEQCEKVLVTQALSAMTEASEKSGASGLSDDGIYSQSGTSDLADGGDYSQGGGTILALNNVRTAENSDAQVLSGSQAAGDGNAQALDTVGVAGNGSAQALDIARAAGNDNVQTLNTVLATGSGSAQALDTVPAAGDDQAQILSAARTGKMKLSYTVSGLSIGRDEIKALLEQYGYDSSIIDSLTDEELEQYVQQYIQQYLGGDSGTSSSGSTGGGSGTSSSGSTGGGSGTSSSGSTGGGSGTSSLDSTGSNSGSSSSDGAAGSAGSQELSDILATLDVSSILNSESFSLDKNTQLEIIENLPVPEVLKDLLITYNNDEGYAQLQADTFQEYLIQFIAAAILNVVSFIASVILVQLLLWIIIAALNIFSRIPVISGVNHLAGLALGLVQALFFLWIFFLLLAMLQSTGIGQQLMSMVTQSERLSWLYESNLFLQIVFRTAALFQ